MASVLAAAPAPAQQAEPEWPQFQAGPGHPGTLGDGPAPPYRVRWTMPAPQGAALSGAVIFEGQAISLGEAAVYGIDLTTGEIAWEVPRAGGPLSVPAIVAGVDGGPATLLYLEGPSSKARSGGEAPSPSETGSPSGSTAADGAEAGSDLVAIELGGRTELWRVPLGATSRTGVAVGGDAAYVADDDGMVYAVALAGGSVRWAKELGEADDPCAGFPNGKVDVPLAIADGRVIAVVRSIDGSSVAIGALDAASGDCVWQKSPQIGSSTTSAAAAGDGRVVIGLADRFVRSFGGSDGEQAWASLALSFFSPVSSPALTPDSMYVVDLGGGVYRLDVADGARVWDYQLNEVVIRSSPVVSGRTVLVGLRDGRLVAIDGESGHLVWESEPTPGLVGAIALSADAVVAVKGGRDAGLIAFEHDPDGALVDMPSPTELEAGALLVRAGAAAAIVFAAVLVPGMLARRRFGGAFPGEDPVDEEPGASADTT